MKIGIFLAVIGGITATLGVIFHLQGQSIVGPESSFMYSNPNWITYGLQISIIGVIITIVGIIIKVIIKRN
ncbi:MAG: hypothetical protein IS860_07555 [Nitrosopumilus sp.]|nr:hypothetical protein [Nitrosopumilus sp.]MCE2505991.1 hypothetical protein [Nitrosopumilaceae archaeon]